MASSSSGVNSPALDVAPDTPPPLGFGEAGFAVAGLAVTGVSAVVSGEPAASSWVTGVSDESSEPAASAVGPPSSFSTDSGVISGAACSSAFFSAYSLFCSSSIFSLLRS